MFFYLQNLSHTSFLADPWEITPDRLVLHFILRNEFCFQRLFSPPHEVKGDKSRIGQIMTVIDVKGVGVSDISADVIRY